MKIEIWFFAKSIYTKEDKYLKEELPSSIFINKYPYTVFENLLHEKKYNRKS